MKYGVLLRYFSAGLLGSLLSGTAMASLTLSAGVGQGDGKEWTSSINPDQAYSAVKKSDKNSAYTVAIGYNWGRFLGVELNHTNLGQYTAQFSNTDSQEAVYTRDITATGVDVVLTLGTQVALYGKAGVAYVSNKKDDVNLDDLKDELTKVTPHYAVGLEYNIMPPFSIFTEYQVHKVPEVKDEEVVTEDNKEFRVKTTNIGIKLRF